MAARLQGWSEFKPLFVSPAMGFLNENLAVSEFARFFINRGMKPNLHFLRTKEKVEVDILVELPNQRFLAVEIKLTPQDLVREQINMLESLKINIVDRWIVSPINEMPPRFSNARVVPFIKIAAELSSLV